MYKLSFIICLLLITEKNFGQSLDQIEIDNICIAIEKPDSIYRRVLMKVALRPLNDGYEYNRYFIDTVNNRFLLVIAWREGSNLGRYYYFLNKQLLKVVYKQKKKGKYITKATLYFKNRKLMFEDDKYNLSKNQNETIKESNNFLDFVKSIKD